MTNASPSEIDNILASSLGEISGFSGMIFSCAYPINPAYSGLLLVVSTRIGHSGLVLNFERSISISRVDVLSLRRIELLFTIGGFCGCLFSLACFNRRPIHEFQAGLDCRQSLTTHVLPEHDYKHWGNIL